MEIDKNKVVWIDEKSKHRLKIISTDQNISMKEMLNRLIGEEYTKYQNHQNQFNLEYKK